MPVKGDSGGTGHAVPMADILILAARLVAIAGILFLSVFALDVFGTGAPWHEVALGLVIHLIPNLVLAGVLVLAWLRPVIGGGIYLALSVVPFVLLGNPAWVNAMLAGPFAVSGLLFVIGGLLPRSPSPPRPPASH